MKQISMLEILNDTVGYYSADVSRRALSKDGCMYINPQGCKCAVGRYMVNPSTDMLGSVEEIHFEHEEEVIDIDSLLHPEYMGHDIDFWEAIQDLHDTGSFWNPGGGLTKRGEENVEMIKRIFKL